MPAIKAIETSIGLELAAFSRYLWACAIPHRVFEDAAGRQVLVVANEEHAARVREDFQRWRAGELDLSSAAPPRAAGPGGMARALRTAPATAVLMLLSTLGALLAWFDDGTGWLHWLTFTDFRMDGGKPVFDGVSATYGRGEYWRLLTPVFLHFGLMHITFNLLWVWEFGRRLERSRGSGTLLGVFAITGAGGNIAQYLIGGSAMFGGMSGVIYGLLGYAWLWSRITRDPRLALPRGVLGFMVGWLLLCMSGLVEALGFGAIANAAHAAGLALGALLGFGAALLYSPPRPSGV